MSLPCLPFCANSAPRRHGESTVCRTVQKTEKILINHPDFHLPRNKDLLLPDFHKITAIDATESPIERPSKKQKKYYNGKQKQHTFKLSVIIDLESKEYGI